MKPILFATNYTSPANNAGRYAAQLAKQLNTSLVIMHTWTVPVYATESIVIAPDSSEYTREEQQRVEKEAERLREEWGVQTTGISVNGFAPNEITDYVRQHDISLVVLGAHEHTLLSRLAGTTSTTLMHHAGFPVLLVPENATYNTPDSFLLASDSNKVPGYEALAILKTLVRKLNAKLDVVHVQQPEHIWNMTETPDTFRLEHSLRFVDHAWRFELNDDTSEGIQQAASKVKADWIVVAPRQFNWLEDIFRRSTTSKLAFSCNLPILVLPATTN